MSRRSLLLGLALGCVVTVSCLNFDLASNLYNSERDGGRLPSDGGTLDDGGTFVCKVNDQACSGDECCNDLRCGPGLGASTATTCQPKAGNCYRDGFFCRPGDFCCGFCDGGTCVPPGTGCNGGQLGARCVQLSDCCPPLSCNGGLCSNSQPSCGLEGAYCGGTVCCSGLFCNAQTVCQRSDAGCAPSCPTLDGGP